MKIFQFSFVLFALFMLVACGSDQARNTDTGQPLPGPTAFPTTGDNNVTTTTTPPAGAAGVKHYTCPNNCEGNPGDTRGPCPECGTELVHNAAFHSAGGANSTTTTITPPGNTTTTPSTTTPPPANLPTPTPSTSAVAHYTCPSGCGGYDSRGACPKCGAELSHNAAFHQ